MLIEVKDKQILIDGKPELIMAGEVHYFRLAKEDWQDRLHKLKAAGLNTVASYIPWLCHEFIEGELDFEGRTRPQLDLAGFIELCAAHNLYFFARPGPFIMAEMKNEGLPYWLYEKHPEIIPVTWDGQRVPTPTVDYLAPNFLRETRGWYQAVMAVLEPRLITNGGNVIALQLDNEVGMLSWVSNSPDLTDNVLEDFTRWLKANYEPEVLSKRYPMDLDSQALSSYWRSPQEEYIAAFTRDLGYYNRDRFARYIRTLRGYAEEFGVKEIPFIVNIHGSGGGRGLTYPIGISQLYEAYTQAPGYLAGSDYYLGDITMRNFQDLYLCNAFMDAVNTCDQPLTAVEFACGDGNYGNDYGGRLDPSASDFATRMCLAQGNRLFNCYLFCGGVNYQLPESVGDGNERIAITGERHGFAAPVSPEGELNYTYPRMARVFQMAMGMKDKLATMEEEWDGVRFAFIPDYYLTEYAYPQSQKVREILGNIEANRGPGAWEIVARAMLLTGLRFGAFDIQNNAFSPTQIPALVVPLARYLSRSIQQALADYVMHGGRLLIYGELPHYDLEGNPCSILINALGVKVLGERRASSNCHLSVIGQGWASTRPEVRTHFAQVCDGGEHTVLFKVVHTQETCGFEGKVGQGHVIFIGTAYPCDLTFFAEAFGRLGVTRGLSHDHPQHGLFMTSSSNDQGERFLHILNLDGFSKEFSVQSGEEAMFDGARLTIGPKDGLMLPIEMGFPGGTVHYATTELVYMDETCLRLRLTQVKNQIVLSTDKELSVDQPHTKSRLGKSTVITILHPGGENPVCTVRFG